MMKKLRFVGSNEARPASLAPEKGGVASRLQTLELPDGTFLLRCEFPGEDALGDAQQIPGLTVFSSLQFAAEKMPQPQKDWLAARNVTIKAGDDTLNALRAIRDAAGVSFEQFDISMPF